MGRPSKLTPKKWDDLLRRYLAGEKAADLARKFGISPTQISKRVSQDAKRVETVAAQVAQAETALESLPISQQTVARTLADQLKGITTNLASAAESGSRISQISTKLAETHMERVADEADTRGLMIEDLKPVAALLDVANRAAAQGQALMAANKGAVKVADSSVLTPEEADRVVNGD